LGPEVLVSSVRGPLFKLPFGSTPVCGFAPDLLRTRPWLSEVCSTRTTYNSCETRLTPSPQSKESGLPSDKCVRVRPCLFGWCSFTYSHRAVHCIALRCAALRDPALVLPRLSWPLGYHLFICLFTLLFFFYSSCRWGEISGRPTLHQCTL
jgi:hypothetical protein